VAWDKAADKDKALGAVAAWARVRAVSAFAQNAASAWRINAGCPAHSANVRIAAQP